MPIPLDGSSLIPMPLPPLEDQDTVFDRSYSARPRYQRRSDLFHTIHADHEEVRRRFGRFAAAADHERGARWDQLAFALTAHAGAELDTMFAGEESGDATSWREGRDDLRAQLVEADALADRDPSLLARSQRLARSFERQVEFEEQILLPRLEAGLERRELDSLAVRYERRKRWVVRQLAADARPGSPRASTPPMVVAAPPVIRSEPAFRHARMLVVDDSDPDGRELQRILLAARYTRVETTIDPCAVFELHRRNRYDLILLDLHMPRMSGLEVMGTLARLDPDARLPVVALAADPSDQLLALRAGARDFLTKPLDPSEVVARVAVSLAGRMPEVARHTRFRGLERDVALAAEIYQALLPATLPSCEGYEVSAVSRWVGDASGDVHDVVERPDGRLVLLLADATGHGIGPALCALQLRSMVRIALELGASIDQIVTEADRQLVRDLPADRFVTAFLGELDPVAHRLDYLAPGQGPLLHWRAATSEGDWRNASSPPFGAAVGFERGAPMILARGDVVVLATDGILDRTDADGVRFGSAGVETLLRSLGPDASAAEIARTLEAAVDRHAAGRPADDDATWIVLRRSP